MNILILTQYFSPEVGATQTRMHEFAGGLASLGHEVEVICGTPNHPQGVTWPEHRTTIVKRQALDGFGVTYVRTYATPRKTRARRVGYYGSYAAMATAVGVSRPRPTVLLASSPPLPVAAAGRMIARRYRIPWVMDVRDLWPAAGVAMGELGTGGIASRWATRLEHALYRSAAAITAVTKPFVERIAQLVDPQKVAFIPNGTTEFWLEPPRTPAKRADLGLPSEDFIWTYAGNVGGAQDLETAIKAAELLGPGYRLLVLGDGPARAELEDRGAHSSAGTVEFRDQVGAREARRYLHCSDALLIPLADDPTFGDFVPSKVYDYAATGRPLICAAGAESNRLLTGIAQSVVPGRPGELAAAVRLCREGGSNGAQSQRARQFASQNLRTAQIEPLERTLIEVSEQNGSRLNGYHGS